jgi:hypothetical protein
MTEIIANVLRFLNLHEKMILPCVIVAIIAAIIYFFYPTFAQGAMIQIIARKRNNQEVRLLDGVSYGLKSFLPLFEYHLMVKGFSLTAMITEVAFVMRNMGTGALKIFVPIFGFIAFIGLILSLLFTYVELFVVVDRKNIFQSMKRSMSLVVTHWQHTFLILILLMLIGLRIIFNIILVLVIPIVIFLGIGLFASVALGYIGWFIAGTITLVGFYISGVLGGTLSVFTNAVWTFTFLELTATDELSARMSADEQVKIQGELDAAYEERRKNTIKDDGSL